MPSLLLYALGSTQYIIMGTQAPSILAIKNIQIIKKSAHLGVCPECTQTDLTCRHGSNGINLHRVCVCVWCVGCVCGVCWVWVGCGCGCGCVCVCVRWMYTHIAYHNGSPWLLKLLIQHLCAHVDTRQPTPIPRMRVVPSQRILKTTHLNWVGKGTKLSGWISKFSRSTKTS